MISITDFDPEDTATVNEYNQRAVVRMSDAQILKKTDNPAPRPSDDEDDEEEEEAPAGIWMKTKTTMKKLKLRRKINGL
ncbi:Uncharacterised protein [Weissella viridescens]|uniref:Uncharacterized protein n=1 Tax=Weissella viridescens TaxID=1629 RepID=A0A380P2K3_WEIVI|nr:Uncharacterised protein [Weissella viridescens]